MDLTNHRQINNIAAYIFNGSIRKIVTFDRAAYAFSFVCLMFAVCVLLLFLLSFCIIYLHQCRKHLLCSQRNEAHTQYATIKIDSVSQFQCVAFH